MAAVTVARLRLKTPPDRAGLTTHRVTDALRLAPAGPERLLLVRRLALGKLSLAGRPTRWEARAAEALAEQSNRAVHGADAGPDAEAVWFRSVAEARALLLMQLLAGRRPTAWFWRLAVPEWEGLTLEAWLPRWISLAAREPAEEVALARAVIAATEAGRLDQIMAAVAATTAGIAAGLARTATSARAPAISPLAPDPPDTAEAPELRRAEATFARLPLTARRAIEQALAASPPESTQAAWLVRLALLAVAPELGFARELLDASAQALVAQAHKRAAEVSATPGTPARPELARPEAMPGERPRWAGTPDQPTTAHQPSPAPTEAEPSAPIDAQRPSPRPDASVERTSRLAGLFLVLRPLARMGFGEWLEARPELAADGFARGLLRVIGRRMGGRPDDAALETIAGEDDPAWADDLTAWRVGLDRWLRRTARIRLADVVRRPGGLLLSDDVLEVRFSPAAADVRLRRLALDLDPNWTPWLGLSVRYHYRDEPLT